MSTDPLMSFKAWNYKICDCTGNCVMCLWSACIPMGLPFMQCVTANHVESDSGIKAFFCAWCCMCFGAAYNRTDVRNKFKLEGNYCSDCCVSWCCPLCAVT